MWPPARCNDGTPASEPHAWTSRRRRNTPRDGAKQTRRCPRLVPRAACLAEDALPARGSGERDRHDKATARAATALPEVDVIAQGQFSLAREENAVPAASGRTVVTTPAGAVRELQRLVMRKEAA